MRFHFPNLDRPKKAAKRIARLLGGAPPLSKVQNGLAAALGYRDWHELDLAHASQPPQPLDQDLPAEDFHRRSADLTLKLAKVFRLSDIEAQYVLLDSRLTGDQVTLDDQFAIRLACWRANDLWPSSGMVGTVVRAPASFAGPRQLGMLTADFDTLSRGRPVQIITDNRCGICSRSEIAIPRTPLLPFVPYRLRLAYGVWTEPGGTKVLFSRDYAPMWRLRDGLPPGRAHRVDQVRTGRVVLGGRHRALGGSASDRGRGSAVEIVQHQWPSCPRRPAPHYGGFDRERSYAASRVG
jgi:hypothetical protein